VFGATLTNIIELAKLQENTIFDWKKKQLIPIDFPATSPMTGGTTTASLIVVINIHHHAYVHGHIINR
jgi:hypothetical protein